MKRRENKPPRRPSMRLAGRFIVPLLLVVALLAPSGALAQAEPVKAHFPPLIFSAPWIIANDLGYFKEEGVNIEMKLGFMGLPTLIQLMSGGKMQLMWANPNAGVNNAILRGAPLLAVAAGTVIHKDYPFIGMIVSDRWWKQGVRTIKDLKGRKVDLAMGWDSTAGRMFHGLLTQAGLDPYKDVTVKEWPSTRQIVQSMMAGQIDVMTAAEPRITFLRNKIKAHPIAWAGQVKSGDVSLLVAMHKGWANSNRETAVKILRAYLKGIRIYKKAQASGWKDLPQVSGIMAKRLRVPPPILKQMTGPYYPSDGRIDVAALRKGMQYFVNRGSIKKLVPVESYIDQSFLEAALK